MENNKIFPEFEQNLTNEKWKEAVGVDLKGRPFEKICFKTYEGFTINPYYRQEDLKGINYLDTVPS